MAQISVAQFASELKVPPSVLLEQLRAAGVDKKQPNDSLSESPGCFFSTPAARSCSSSTEGGTFSSLANCATLVWAIVIRLPCLQTSGRAPP